VESIAYAVGLQQR